MKKVITLILGLAALVTSCKKDSEDKCAFVPDTSGIVVEIQWESLEDSLPAITTKNQLVDFFTQHPDLRDLFFNRTSYPDDSVFINELYQRFTNPHIDTLLIETHNVFGDASELKKQFAQAFANFKYYYPDFVPPKIKTVITGLETDLYVSDSLIIIGMDYFLGPGARYQPNMYDYMKRRYHKDFIVPSVMLLFGIDSRYNKINPTDRSVLAEIIAYGKAYHFAKSMVPCTPDSILSGYTAEEIEGSRKNENLIWSRFIEDQVLYSTNHFDKQKYIAERPKTLEVGEKCPGRIGQWVGWQMVKKYSETHSDKTLPQIMEVDNAPQLFKESGYRPQLVDLPERKKI